MEKMGKQIKDLKNAGTPTEDDILLLQRSDGLSYKISIKNLFKNYTVNCSGCGAPVKFLQKCKYCGSGE
jgi:hypothetical protein